MKSWEVEEMAKKEGYREGIQEMQNRINQLIIKLTEEGRTEDIIKSARDKEYQNALFEEFGI